MMGITEFSFDKNGSPVGYENSGSSFIKKALKNFPEKKYIGKFPNGNAEMYRISSESILVIWKDAEGKYSAAGLVSTEFGKS